MKAGPIRRISPYRAAMWIGLLYMWTLVMGGHAIVDAKPDNKLASIVVIMLTVVAPLILSLAYSLKFGEQDRHVFLITGIPAVMGWLLQYFLLSFIPYMVVPPGVMNHIIGPAHPFDPVGQIIASLPILAWALIFPCLGQCGAWLVRSARRKAGARRAKKVGQQTEPM